MFAVGSFERDRHESIGGCVRERLPQGAVRNGKRAGVDAETESQRENDRGGQTRIVPQRPHTVAEVLTGVLQPGPDPDITHFVVRERHVADGPARGPRRRVGFESTCLQLSPLHLQVESQLLIEFVLDAVSPQDMRQTPQEPVHDAAYVAPITL